MRAIRIPPGQPRAAIAILCALSFALLADRFGWTSLREYFAAMAGFVAAADVLRWIRGDTR